MIICIFVHLTDIDDILIYKFQDALHDETELSSEIWLNNYTLENEPTAISCIQDNLSGITFNSETETLFVITNGPAHIYEISCSGVCLKKIILNNFQDTEGIVYLYANIFAVIEERKHNIRVLKINNETSEIGIKDQIHYININLKKHDNRGFEGISYNPNTMDLYIVNEKKPRELIKIKGLLDHKNISISLKSDLLRFDLFMNDFSGLHFDPASGHLLFLSHEAKLLAEVSLEGKQIGFMDLRKGFSGLTKDIPQAEGVAMDNAGNIYIVSEPNLFYKFKKKAN